MTLPLRRHPKRIQNGLAYRFPWLGSLASALVLLLSFPPANAEARFALVIGNNAYENARALVNPKNDAVAIAAKLRTAGFEVTEKTDATKKGMKDALREFSGKVPEGSVCLIYYAGHGVQIKGQNYLVPIDAKMAAEYEVPDETLCMDTVVRALAETKSKLNIFVLDCCRDDPFARSWKGTRSVGTSSGLVMPADMPQGMFVAFSTSPNTTADDGEGKNSPYATALLEELGQPGIDFEKVFKNVGAKVAKATDGRQEPWSNSKFYGSFSFIPSSGLNDARPQMPDPIVTGQYTSWSAETLAIAEQILVQESGQIKTLSALAGSTLLSLLGSNSTTIEVAGGSQIRLNSMDWLMDILFRPQIAIKQPSFRIDNSSVLEAIAVKPRHKNGSYSYSDIEPGRNKLIALAKAHELIEKTKRDPTQIQTIALAYNFRNYESLLGYFGFARSGVTLRGSGKDGSPDLRADISALMGTAPQIKKQIQQSKADGKPISPHLQSLMEQIVDSANWSKFGLFMLPPADPKVPTWLSAGNAIMSVFTDVESDSDLAAADIKSLEVIVRSLDDDAVFRKHLSELRDDFVKRTKLRGEYPVN